MSERMYILPRSPILLWMKKIPCDMEWVTAFWWSVSRKRGVCLADSPTKNCRLWFRGVWLPDLREVQADAVSANIRIEKLEAEKITCTATSGAWKVNSSICPTSFKASSVSGGVTLFIPENNGFSLSFDKVSGAFYSDFSMTLDNGKGIYRDGGNLLIVDTVSGNCSIRRNKWLQEF